jgi:uncharacterized protein (DUF4415 family)
MKKRRKVTPRRLQRTISRLRASEDAGDPLAMRPRYRRRNKKQIRLYLDADVLAWFKREGRGYQTRINRALWKLMKDEKMNSGE